MMSLNEAAVHALLKMRETESALFHGARAILDTKDAIAESGDLIDPRSAGSLDFTTIRDPTMDLLSEKEITFFKEAGMAAEDLAVAGCLVVRQAALQQNLRWNTDTLSK
jgi:ornithine cyclodeaminase/alanine dehydrogenase-like protein (mu-crystallin family)